MPVGILVGISLPLLQRLRLYLLAINKSDQKQLKGFNSRDRWYFFLIFVVAQELNISVALSLRERGQ